MVSLRFGKGVIVGIQKCDTYPIEVLFDDGKHRSYRLKGFHSIYDNTQDLYWPGFKIIPAERPKRKVKKLIEVIRYQNIYDEWDRLGYKTREEADNNACPGRIACVEFKGSYEIEVEE